MVSSSMMPWVSPSGMGIQAPAQGFAIEEKAEIAANLETEVAAEKNSGVIVEAAAEPGTQEQAQCAAKLEGEHATPRLRKLQLLLRPCPGRCFGKSSIS